MLRILGSILAGLLVLQGAIPSIGLEPPWANIAAVAVSIAVAAISFYLKDAPA